MSRTVLELSESHSGEQLLPLKPAAGPQAPRVPRSLPLTYAVGMNFDWTTGPLAEGLRLYNSGEYFTAHEAWEGVWLQAPEPEKRFLQGLIQVTAGCHHLTRRNRLGTVRLFSNALQRLDPRGPEFGGIAVGLLCGDISDRLNHLAEGEATTAIQPPRIIPLCHNASATGAVPAKFKAGG